MRDLLKTIAIILFISGMLTAVVITTGWEIALVTLLNNPTDTFSWWLRNYGKYPAIIVSILLIIFMLIPYLRNKSAVLRRCAITWLVALIFGAGLIGGFITVEGFDRPRPRETILLEGTEKYTPPFVISDAKKGKSFTSGHAAMGFIFAAPFFALRRKFPKTSYGFLAGGLIFGGVLGYTRMVLGAHFITDIIWSAAFILILGAIGNYLWKDNYIIKSKYIILFFVFVAVAIAYFNKFERVITLKEIKANTVTINTNCDSFSLNSGENFSIAYTVTGYGAPVKNLAIEIIENQANLKATGLFRELQCTKAVIKVPTGKKLIISNNKPIIMGNKPLFMLKRKPEHLIFTGEDVKND